MFVPTHEWQEIQPGQAIPPGLHVRMDFQTGKKEAKIWEPDADSAASDGAIVVTPQEPDQQYVLCVSRSGDVRLLAAMPLSRFSTGHTRAAVKFQTHSSGGRASAARIISTQVHALA